ncbi:hypothetical protein TVAG_060340 [Trichomonas vaginalis G3]|uniref:Uncharacterized protein n=1 Tax=Trichomonas vaginalis (strain ATCC PRA-98 / G3) TaxID=412133 RepID=A2ECG3_TRIV3|nr:hypothetical protein TVAGG3_0311700 [Trichomonas vaginalis G3]EAY09658.1 hypothetical protein TVAG_060340 [Trichomonas vaginalis G3]KAI5528660.1 hypothetical protein TVAGG3_0311700 [Trichomonas vaginalis G3]|eukprot:XP_001321881.1 hypothetical protein [Trichomonas vaginalis G3]
MEYCNLANNFIQNHLINAAIRIFDNEFKISYCNLLHRIDDNMYYQSQPKGKFIVSNCFVLQSNKHVKNGFVNTFNVDSREEKYINFATYFIQEFQAYAENRNKATPLQTPIITPVVTSVGTPVKTNAQTPAGTFFVTPAVTFGVTPAITPAGTPVITPAGTPVITPEKTPLPTEKTPEPSDLPDYLSMNYKHAYRKPIY